MAAREKEFLYVGHYIDKEGNYILKIGTTNDLQRRAAEHNYNYRNKAKEHKMPAGSKFQYDWHIKLSKYNTLRFEDRNRQRWQDMDIGEFVRNDRFVCKVKPEKVTITIRKTYEIRLE